MSCCLLLVLSFTTLCAAMFGHRIHKTWDARGQAIFEQTWKQALSAPRRVVKMPYTEHEIVVADTAPHNWFWNSVDARNWEMPTFQVFLRFIDERTTVVDFGAWIGPTVLFHAFLSKKSYAIEGDPAAFAVLKLNVQLNHARDQSLQIELVPAVVALNHSMIEMHSASPGNSCSGIATVGCGTVSASWLVQAVRLPDLFASWRIPADDNVFIKIDVESFECALVPSFLSWLSGSAKPTFFIAMHADNVSPCTVEQYRAITTFIKSFAHAFCVDTGAPVFEPPSDTEIRCKTGEILMTDRGDGV
jgi:FkbM family methyltransferase